jgi:hypothetical protein
VSREEVEKAGFQEVVLEAIESSPREFPKEGPSTYKTSQVKWVSVWYSFGRRETLI